MRTLDKNADLGLLILRVSIAGLMLFHGISKIFYGPGMIEQIVTGAGLPSFIAYGVYAGEVIAPLFILFGYATRVAALILAFNLVVATALVHTQQIFTLNDQGGWALELIGLYLFGALALVFTGGGKYALSLKYLWD